MSDSEKKLILSAKQASSLDIPISDLIRLTEQKEKKSSENGTELVKESKSPAYLPQPFSRWGWLGYYISLNAVLLGLYILLAGPYFVSGQAVNSFSPPDSVKDPDYEAMMMDGYMGEDMMGDEMKEENGTEETYMGYTTYGDSDVIIPLFSYFLTLYKT